MNRKLTFKLHHDNRTRTLLGLFLFSVGVILVILLGWGRKNVSALNPGSPTDSHYVMRGYYLTETTHNGNQAITACAPGYHFASLWEILDPSKLKYNTDLGLTRDDSGYGPPTYITPGWVRTGWFSAADNQPGIGNCKAWSSAESGHYGTFVTLTSDWSGGDEDIHVWDAGTAACNAPLFVWCVEGFSILIHLPALMSDPSN
jgi:hypothetical protein